MGLLVLLALAPGAWAQETVPEFDVDVVSKRGAALSLETEVDLYTRIPHPQLTFISTPDGFTARYEVSVDVVELDDQGLRKNIVLTRLWDGKVVVPTYSDTQEENRSAFSMQTLSLAPGHYMFEMQVEDREAGRLFTRELPVEVRDLNRPVALSDLSLLDDFDEKTYAMVPRVSNRIGTNEMALKLFYEVYTEQNQEVLISHEVVRTEKDGGLPLFNGVLDAEAGEGGEVLYEKTKPTRLKGRTNQYIVDIPVDEQKVGVYVVRVRVEDPEGHLLDMAQKAFMAHWSGLNEHIENIDEAIAQLEYIAKKKDLNYIREARDPAERYRRFMAFWEKRDPTPGTKRNERMEEYYYRVAYANDRYSHAMAGWKTDRGYVMVRFGEPDFVERHPFSFNAKPYEIWTYYSIGRRFVFIDETGLGDYRLWVPIWDERTRIR